MPELVLPPHPFPKRPKQVHKKLLALLAVIRDEMKEERSGLSQSNSNSSAILKDTLEAQLHAILEEVEILKKNVEEFTGFHFTKKYRTLQGDCEKLQLDLDKLDVTGRDDIRNKRRKALITIDEQGKALAKKTHSSGKSCEFCEIQV